MANGGWPREDLEPVTRCPVCDSGERSVLHEALTDLAFRVAPGTWTLHQCGQCRSAYLDPRPTPESIHRAYEDYYTHSAEGEAPVSGMLPGIAGALANGYRNWQYGSRLEPALKAGVPLCLLVPALRRRIDGSTRYLPPVHPGARLLDVGFGSGGYLRLAQSMGWDVAGVDFDEVAVQRALATGLKVRTGGPEAMLDEVGQFDVVTLNHTLEHVYDPGETLRHVYALLKPGGMLHLETPNIDAHGHSHFGEYWRGLEPPRHLVIFSPGSLDNLVRESGFTLQRRLSRPEEYARMAEASRSLRGMPAGWLERMTDVLRGLRHCLSPARATRSEMLTITAIRS